MAFLRNYKDKLSKFGRKGKKKCECVLGKGKGRERPIAVLKHSLESPMHCLDHHHFFKVFSGRLNGL
jgi:hypothetical protein